MTNDTKEKNKQTWYHILRIQSAISCNHFFYEQKKNISGFSKHSLPQLDFLKVIHPSGMTLLKVIKAWRIEASVIVCPAYIFSRRF